MAIWVLALGLLVREGQNAPNFCFTLHRHLPLVERTKATPHPLALCKVIFHYEVLHWCTSARLSAVSKGTCRCFHKIPVPEFKEVANSA